MLLLIVALGVVVYGFTSSGNKTDENKRFKVGITGDTDAKYIKSGMAALTSLDDTRFSMEVVIMEREEAEKSLITGDIAAFVILPEDFIERALYGDMDKVTYVTSSGAETVATMFKNEITKVISDIVLYTQKGTYAIDEAVNDTSVPDPSGKYMNKLSIEYVDLILNRSDIFEVTETGESNSVSLSNYYIGAIVMIVLLFSGLPFVTVYVIKDASLSSLLVSKGFRVAKQLFCETTAHFFSMLALCATLFSACIVALLTFNINLIGVKDLIGLFFAVIPVLVMISCFNIFIFEISSNITSVVLIYFFTVLSLCYICGCFYPIYTFPVSLQKFSSILPVSAAREYLSVYLTGKVNVRDILVVLLYAVAFYALALLFRRNKISAKRGIKNEKYV